MRTLVLTGRIGPAFATDSDPRYVDVETMDIYGNTYRVHARYPGIAPSDTRADTLNGTFRSLSIVASDPDTALALTAH